MTMRRVRRNAAPLVRGWQEVASATSYAADRSRAGILRKADFWQRHSFTPLSERQRTILNRVLGEFEGKPTGLKRKALANCSMATAQRDLKDLVNRGLLIRSEGGSRYPRAYARGTLDQNPKSNWSFSWPLSTFS
jgi:Fic family protein